MKLLATSTLSNQNISSALLAATYTADAARFVFVRLFLDQIAGNGDYTAYITLQRAGAGSEYRVVPITTTNVASGVTAAAFTTIGVSLTSTDVLKVYASGLAGDTTNVDLITEVWEDDAVLNSVWTNAKAAYVDAAISGRAATGDAMTLTAAYDAAKTAAPTGAAMTLTAAYDAAKTAAPTGAAMTLTAAYDAAKTAAAAGASMALTGAAVDAIWDEATSGHATAGTTGKALTDILAFGTPPTAATIWAYASRTLTTPAATQTTSTDTAMVLYVAANNTVVISSIDTTGLSELYLTIKDNLDKADSLATVQASKSTGLLYLNGAATTAAWATLTNDATSATFTLLDHATALLVPGEYDWDLKMTTSAGAAVPLASGTCTVIDVVTKTIP